MNGTDHVQSITTRSRERKYCTELSDNGSDLIEKNIALVLSGGIGSRMNSKVPKQYLKMQKEL